MRFDISFLDKVKESNNIVDVIGQYTTLKGSGSGYMGLCPFPDHNEKSGSFSVSADRQLYHCFGCKKSGDILTFLQDHSGLGFVEAVEELARRASIPMPENPVENNSNQKRVDKGHLMKVNRLAAVFFHRSLKELASSKEPKDYLAKREISAEIIEEFRLGYAPDEWNDLTNLLKSKGVKSSDSEDLGLIRAQKNKNGHYDMFRDRIMFPIFSISGDVIGFGGRVISQAGPKYINSPETPLFNKRKVFYGLNWSAKYIKEQNQVLVVEGYMDFISLYSQGIKNVVATLGTALTKNHLKLIKRHTTNLVILFDGDSAGKQAAERSLPLLLEEGFSPKGLFLAEGMDPDDFLKEKGADNFRQAISGSKELVTLIFARWFKGYGGGISEKNDLLEKLKTLLQDTSVGMLKSLVVKEFADRIGEDSAWVLRTLQSSSRPAKSQTPVREKTDIEQPNIIVGRVSLKGVKAEELYTLVLSTKYIKSLEKIKSSGVVDKITHSGVKQLLSLVLESYRQRPESFDSMASLVLTRVEEAETFTGKFESFTESEPSDEEEKLLANCIKRVLDSHLRRQMLAIATDIRDDASAEKLEQIVNIQKTRRQL